MTRRFPSSRPGGDRFDELDDPALAALIADARAAPAEADRGPTLETALAVFRVAAAPPTVGPEPEPVVRPTRRHRLVRAVAATTLATKVLLGVATAAALGGIGVAVTETVHHHSPPRAPVTTTAPVTTPPPSAEPTGGTGSADPTPSGSPTSTSPTASPTTTVTDTASVGASGSTSPRGSASPTGSGTSGGPGATRSSSPPPSASPRGVTPSESSDGTGDR